jgi:hypothetical protein
MHKDSRALRAAHVLFVCMGMAYSTRVVIGLASQCLRLLLCVAALAGSTDYLPDLVLYMAYSCTCTSSGRVSFNRRHACGLLAELLYALVANRCLTQSK